VPGALPVAASGPSAALRHVATARATPASPLALARSAPAAGLGSGVPAARSSSGGAGSTESAGPLVSRLVADGASNPAPSALQAAATPAAGLTTTPIVQRVEGSAPAAPQEEGRSETELDELARALFGRMRTHLRAEVIHEREAKGLTFDAF